MLSTEEIEHYRREGWVVPRFRLPPARMAAMVDALETLLRQNPGVRPEKLVSAHIERRRQRRRRARQPRVPRPRARPGDRRAGVRRARRGRDPLGLPRVLQAGGARLRDALAPGRPLLADPPARDLYRVGCAGAIDGGKRLPARDS